MNWEAIGAVAEMIAAVGVILTLGYLAFQIRQNTQQLAQNERTSIAAAVNVAVSNYRENRRYIYSSAELTDIVLKGLADPQSLGESDLYRFRLLIHNVVDSLLDIYGQTVTTGYSPATWDMLGVNMVERVLATAGGRWFWSQLGDNYIGDFRVEIDRILDSSSNDS